jgi:pimeloyl-ACP methyl ester carboxylesterase
MYSQCATPTARRKADREDPWRPGPDHCSGTCGWSVLPILDSMAERKQLIIHGTPGIDEAFFVDVRSTQQWVAIRGRNRSNPVVMMIHGGPGVSNAAFATDLLPYETDFTFVQWDQPGNRQIIRPRRP